MKRTGTYDDGWAWPNQTGFAATSVGIIDGVGSVNDIRSYDVLDI